MSKVVRRHRGRGVSRSEPCALPSRNNVLKTRGFASQIGGVPLSRPGFYGGSGAARQRPISGPRDVKKPRVFNRSPFWATLFLFFFASALFRDTWIIAGRRLGPAGRPGAARGGFFAPGATLRRLPGDTGGAPGPPGDRLGAAGAPPGAIPATLQASR